MLLLLHLGRDAASPFLKTVFGITGQCNHTGHMISFVCKLISFFRLLKQRVRAQLYRICYDNRRRLVDTGEDITRSMNIVQYTNVWIQNNVGHQLRCRDHVRSVWSSLSDNTIETHISSEKVKIPPRSGFLEFIVPKNLKIFTRCGAANFLAGGHSWLRFGSMAVGGLKNLDTGKLLLDEERMIIEKVAAMLRGTFDMNQTFYCQFVSETLDSMNDPVF